MTVAGIEVTQGAEVPPPTPPYRTCEPDPEDETRLKCVCAEGYFGSTCDGICPATSRYQREGGGRHQRTDQRAKHILVEVE